MSVRARLFDYYKGSDNKKLKKGSFGWGLYNNTDTLISPEYTFVWFKWQEGSRFYPWNGLTIWSHDNGEFSIKKIKGYNVREWHVYAINWTEDSYDCYIDGKLVAQITRGVAQEEMGIEIWSDNAVWYPGRGIEPKRKGIFSYLNWVLYPRFCNIFGMRRVDLDYIKITE